MEYTIGLDLGGTAIKGGVIDAGGRIVARRSIPTENELGVRHVLDRLAGLARSLAEEAKLKENEIGGVGVGTPGPLDVKGETVLLAPNLGWKDVALKTEMSRRLPWRVRVVNDANAAGYGEYHAVAGRGVRNLILLTLGTGIGSGIILDGKLFIGPHGGGAELGHTVVERGGRACGCGQRGCLEQYASATAIVREAMRRIDAGQATRLPARPTAKDVFDYASAGDALAEEVVEEACECLAVACVSFVHAFDPEWIVLGGGVAEAGSMLLDEVGSRFAANYWRAAPAHVRFELSTLGNDAGFIGAAYLARER